MAIENTKVPTLWLAGVVKLLNEMAGEGVGMADCEDPAELMMELAEHLSTTGADDPWLAVIEKLAGVATRPRWRVSPDDDRNIQKWDGLAWVFDCCTMTAAQATKWVADNIAEEANV